MGSPHRQLTREQAASRIEKLRLAINRHRYEYHVLDHSSMDDEAFDALKHELKQLEDRYPEFITPDSPTQRVGGDALASFEKVAHATPMLSIEDIFTAEELLEWEAFLRRQLDEPSFEYFCEGKMDGLAIALHYEDGVYAQALTRGNGKTGENVTSNVKTIESIPLRLRLNTKTSPSHLEVRGEVYIRSSDFEKLNAQRAQAGESVYANPRNLAAGSIRQLDPALAAARPLSFRAYDVLGAEALRTHMEKHQLLRSMGFATDPTASVHGNTDGVISYWKQQERAREKSQIPLDGVVVRINDSELFLRLGVAGKSPRGIRAFKFTPRQAATKLLDIRTQVGRTGAVTPIAVLEPIALAGVIVSRATLHNEDEIKRLGVKIGDTVIVARAGDVIPAITSVVEEMRDGTERTFHMPKRCPVCNTPLERKEGEVAWRCPNSQCDSRKHEALAYFVSRKNFNIEGLGPQILTALVDAELVNDAADLFTLEKGDLVQLERFGEKSAQNLIEAIDRSKRISLSRFISALNIRHVGEETAIDLARHFGSIEALCEASIEELESIEGVGGVVAASLQEWFRNEANRAFLKRLFDTGVSIEAPATTGTSLRSKTFVFTGTLSKMSREEAEEEVRARGGSASSSVSSRTDYVVVGENAGSKAEEARRLGVTTLNEEEFLNILK